MLQLPLPSALIVSHLIQNRSREELETLGGVDGLAESLRTNLKSGLDAKTDGTGSLAQREQAYGANKFKDVPQKAFFRLFWENLKDPTLVLLMAAALVCHYPSSALRPCHN